MTRDFLDEINFQITQKKKQNEKIRETETLPFEDYLAFIREALTETNNFSDKEITSILAELTQGLSTKNAYNLIRATEFQHLHAKQIGLPSLAFLFNLKEESDNRAVSSPRKNKRYTIKLNGSFYQTILENIPTLKFDFESNLYLRLCQEYSELQFPAKPASHDPKTRSLYRIKKQTITIAKILAKRKPETESLLRYAKREAHKERDLPPKVVTLLTTYFPGKNNSSNPNCVVSQNCFRCPALCLDASRRDIDYSSFIPPCNQLINIYRLEAYTTPADALQHYWSHHLGWLGRANENKCQFLLPCLRCISTYLQSGRTELGPHDNIFTCCKNCLIDHNESAHSDDLLFSLRHTLTSSKLEISQHFVDTTNFYLDVQCLMSELSRFFCKHYESSHHKA